MFRYEKIQYKEVMKGALVGKIIVKSILDLGHRKSVFLSVTRKECYSEFSQA